MINGNLISSDNSTNMLSPLLQEKHGYTVKPVCNDHLYNEIYYLWFIQ